MSRPAAAIGLALVAAVLGAVGAARPEAFVAAGAALAFAGLCVAACRWPERALAFMPFVVLLAGTKFRLRGASASLSGQIDAQIVFEIAAYALVGTVVLLAAASRADKLARPQAGTWAVIVYGLVALCSVAWSLLPTLSAIRAVQLAVLIALAYVSMRVIETRKLFRALAASVLAYVVAFSALALLLPDQFGAAYHMVTPTGARFSWVAVHPIECGTDAAIGAVFVAAALLFRDLDARGRSRLPAALLWLVCIAVLVMTKSRGPLIAGTAALGVLVTVRYVRRAMAPALVAAAVVGIAVFANAAFELQRWLATGASSDSPAASLLFRGQTAQDLLGFSGRSELWRGIWQLIAERPFAGYGYQGSREPVLRLMPWAAGAHNALAQSLLDVGIAGTLPLVLAIVIALVACARLAAQRPSGMRLLAGWRTTATILALLTFLLLNGISFETFTGSPGYSALLLFACIEAAYQPGRLRAPQPGGSGRFATARGTPASVPALGGSTS